MPENPEIIARLADGATPEDAIRPFLFHGSGEPLEGAMRPGAYDGVFWTADCPAVAQCYIPRSGGQTSICIQSHRLGERVRPARNDSLHAAAVQKCGREPDVEWDAIGNSRSWTIPTGWPTHAELLSWFREELGYASAAVDVPFWAASSFEGGRDRFLREDHRLQGSLLVVDGRDLNFYDHATGREGDLQDPDHNRLGLFRRVEAAGYDGIVINDFCQSPAWGNVGHRSWGVFASAMARVEWASVPAVSFDWPEERGGLSRTVTPEFEKAWRGAVETRAAPWVP